METEKLLTENELSKIIRVSKVSLLNNCVEAELGKHIINQINE